MMGPTHLATGIIVSAVITTNPVGIIVGSVAALLPDIDEPNSMISKSIPIIPHIIGMFGHRKITHSLIGLFLFSIPAYIWLQPFFWVFVAGYISHLVLDSLTPMGVPLAYPLPLRSISFNLGKSGGVIEALYIVILFVIGALYGGEVIAVLKESFVKLGGF